LFIETRAHNCISPCTQNVDGLDVMAGLPKNKSIAVHGSYSSAQCVQCRTIVPIEKFVEELVEKMATPPLCRKAKCQAFLKPSIVMYDAPQRRFPA
jgi:NAD-dependent histone deacetylase SIR2